MTEETTPRQVLYGLVAGGFVVVTAVLTIGAGVSGLVPTWWSLALAIALVVSGVYLATQWRRTGRVLAIAIGLFIVWMVGTLIVAS